MKLVKLPQLIYSYNTVSFSTTSSSVKEEFPDSVWNFFCDKSPLLRQINISKISMPRISMPPTEKNVAWYDLVLSAIKPGKQRDSRLVSTALPMSVDWIGFALLP